MAIFKPNRTFEGSTSTSNLYKFIKEGPQVVNFRDERNKSGNHFFILPPYKQDRTGAGVSWKVVDVRIDFGVGDSKERFYSADDCPINYFEKRVKLLFPAYAAPTVVKREDGQDRKQYGTFGRNQKQVLYNVAYFRDLKAGCHVMHLPWFNAAEKVDEWHRMKTPEGEDNPLVNDPDHALPIWVQLKTGVGVTGNPWLVRVDNSRSYQLPPELCDSDNLYNLDEVLLVPDKNMLIEKLRAVTPTEIFDKCMGDYLDRMNGGSVSMASRANPVSAPVATPRYNTPAPSQQPRYAQPAEPEVDDIPFSPGEMEPGVPVAQTTTFSNPVAARTVVPAAARAPLPPQAAPQTYEETPQQAAAQPQGPAASRESARAYLSNRKPAGLA